MARSRAELRLVEAKEERSRTRGKRESQYVQDVWLVQQCVLSETGTYTNMHLGKEWEASCNVPLNSRLVDTARCKSQLKDPFQLWD